jgi:HK97 family phage major capsid protein
MSDVIFTDQEVDDLMKNADEKQIVTAVVHEVKRLGDNTKTAYEELRKTVKGMQDKINKDGDNWDEQLKKYVEDITIRQSALDKKASEFVEGTKKRLDEFEAYIQRHGKSSGKDKDENEILVKQFFLEARSANNQNTKFSKMRDFDYNYQNYKDYCEAFEVYLRTDDKRFNTMSDDIKALTVGIDPHGGYTVTPTMANRMLQRMYEMDPIRQLANVETISSSDAWEILVSWGDFGFGWVGETEPRTETDHGDMKKVRIPCHEMYANPFATQILVEDSGINIENWIGDRVADRFARGEATAFVTGNGIKRPRGFLTYPNYAVAGTDEFGAVERINMGAAAALTADGFYDVKFSMIEDYLELGTWLMNRTTLRDALKLTDGAGQYLWSPGLTQDQHSTLLGRPVRMATTMPVVAAGALAVLYADFRRFYTIVDRLGISVIRDPLTNKPFIEFYTRKRVGGDITDFQAGKIGVVAV